MASNIKPVDMMQSLHDMLAMSVAPRGFCLFVFDMDGPGTGAGTKVEYISSADRDGVLALLKAFIASNEIEKETLQ